MPRQHVVSIGECAASIADRHGFTIDTIWRHADNAALRAKRESPYVLEPGDRVTIPDRRLREEACATGRRHVFRRRGVPEKLRIRLLSGEVPRVGLAYELRVDDLCFSGETDGGGWLEHWIPPGARAGRLVLADGQVHELALGQLLPHASTAGARARLANLGYLREPAAAAEDVERAVASFQRDHALEATGALDEQTRRALLDAHGS
ncbi:peptidoglycan-binding domain-containing protein [Sorangium sp. So ce394]|uniref:peptidoglycan-binding domain-containing protein n=1 Tax=Sorangium sp. So ce394 TaxID=3133310 RepID=UPI003F5CA0B3